MRPKHVFTTVGVRLEYEPQTSSSQGLRQEYAALVARGVSNAEACRLVGVARRTGTRWRYGADRPSSGRDRTPLYPAMTETQERGAPALGAVPVRAGAGHHR